MIKISEETQMYIDSISIEELPRDFEYYYDLTTKEELYKEMCMHRSTLNSLEDLCDAHGIEYTNPLKEELNELKVSNRINGIVAWGFAGIFFVGMYVVAVIA